MAKDKSDPFVAKIAAAILTFAIGWLAQKALAIAWKRVSGKDAPKNLDDPEVTVASAALFAAAVAGVGAATRKLARNNAKRMVDHYVDKRAKTPPAE